MAASDAPHRSSLNPVQIELLKVSDILSQITLHPDADPFNLGKLADKFSKHWKVLGQYSKLAARTLFFSSGRAVLHKRLYFAQSIAGEVITGEANVLFLDEILRGYPRTSIQLAKQWPDSSPDTTLLFDRGLLGRLRSQLKPLVVEAKKDPRYVTFLEARAKFEEGLVPDMRLKDWQALAWFYGLREVETEKNVPSMLNNYLYKVGILPEPFRKFMSKQFRSFQSPYQKLLSVDGNSMMTASFDFGSPERITELFGSKKVVPDSNRWKLLHEIFGWGRLDAFKAVLEGSDLDGIDDFAKIVKTYSPARLLSPTLDFSGFSTALEAKWPDEWALYALGSHPSVEAESPPLAYELVEGGDIKTLERLLKIVGIRRINQEVLGLLADAASKLGFRDMVASFKGYMVKGEEEDEES